MPQEVVSDLPLRPGETYHDRDRIDALLQKYWCDRRAWLRTPAEVKKVYLTYGEVTAWGARQLMELLDLRENINRKVGNDNDDVEAKQKRVDDPPLAVFYDLGSGAGKLTVQMVLEKAVTVSIGVELSETRHALALEIWDAMQTNEHFERQDITYTENEDGTCVTVPRVKFQNKNILDADFTNATHIFFSSLCFPEDVVEKTGEIIRENRQKHGKIKVVVALSNIRSLEGPENRVHWKKSFDTILMTWGYSTARIYKYID